MGGLQCDYGFFEATCIWCVRLRVAWERGAVLVAAAPVVRKGQVIGCCKVISKRAVVNTGIFHSLFTDVHSVMKKHSKTCRRMLHGTGSATLRRVRTRTTRLKTGTIVNISLSCRAMKNDNDVLVIATGNATMGVRSS